MKRIIFVAIAAVMLLLLLVPAFAYGTPLTSDMLGGALSGLKTSIRAIVNVGLIILGILLSISLIFRIFSWILSLFVPGFGQSRDQYRGPGSAGDPVSVERSFFGRGGGRPR